MESTKLDLDYTGNSNINMNVNRNSNMNSASLSKSSLEEWVESSSMENIAVSMGVEVEGSSKRVGVSSAIPIMPGNIMGIAREVSAAAMSQQKKAKEM